jgi:GNAT superfamily N-acetyltransferase
VKSGIRIERNWAANADVLAANLAAVDPWWGSKSIPMVGGFLVLCGSGHFINRAVGLAIGEPFTPQMAEEIERSCREAGVSPAVEVTQVSDQSLAQVLRARGYAETATRQVFALDLDAWSAGDTNAQVVIEVVGRTSLPTWQHVSALGWGHSDPLVRSANDSFAAAVLAGENETLLLAYDAEDRRPVGCASLTTQDGVGTLGGMSTVPSTRNRGVQTALVNYRLRMARDAGCDIATSSPITETASARNFVRLGFEFSHEQVTLELPD